MEAESNGEHAEDDASNGFGFGVGLCAMVSAPNGQGVVMAVFRGIDPETLLGADVRLGEPGAPGVPVLELPPPEEWIRSHHGLAVSLVLDALDPELRDWQRQGWLSLNVRTQHYPEGEIRAQLEALPRTRRAGRLGVPGSR
ncbi:MAG: hypothetical protein JXR77_09520 [Lentisphaeria bacterium]|nr:hypothetical protein [Lentisphaeria bacterium]